MGACRGALGMYWTVLRLSWAVSGSLGRPQKAAGELQNGPLGHRPTLWRGLGVRKGCLGHILGRLGSVWGRLGALLGCLGAALRSSRAVLCQCGRRLIWAFQKPENVGTLKSFT